MLMVPLPTAYADHQTANARPMAEAGAGVLLPQRELTPERLASEIERLHASNGMRSAMAAASRALGRPDAAEQVAAIARSLVH
jgi:UDP-N-acetylglucosamine--N-acetylmuramyl-(pentapeptide) pyrophosphoryl-undecaprenol N-acetylglucosamine transferase